MMKTDSLGQIILGVLDINVEYGYNYGGNPSGRFVFFWDSGSVHEGVKQSF